MKQLIRKVVPLYWRQWLRGWLRQNADRRSGHLHQLAIVQSPGQHWLTLALITQPVIPAPGSEGKVHNISIALQSLDGLVIGPGEWFSFWHRIGRPVAENGFQKSRSIVGGKLVAETGGGLCQLSGMLYYLALQSGLRISERHAHSLDIYTEEERFTPLGSDATVAYPYKDLRFENPFGHAVQLHFSLACNSLTGTITTEKPLSPLPIRFEYIRKVDAVTVITYSDETIIDTTSYGIPGTGFKQPIPGQPG